MTTFGQVERLERGIDELLEVHNSRRDVADFQKYWDDPIGFMREELDFRPYPKQVEVIESVLAHKRTVARGCHGAGKDAVLAAIMLWAAYVRGMLVLGLSATQAQLSNQLWREVRNRFSSRLPGELFTGDLRIDGQKRIIAMTANATSASNLTGWHDPQGVFIAISESQAENVGDDAFDAAEANAIDERSRICVVGNPIKAEGRFYSIHSKPSWHAVGISAFEHPNIIEGREVIAGGPAPQWPDEMAREYGRESAFYVSRVLGEFPKEGSVDSLIKRAWVEASFARHDAGVALVRFPLPSLSLDVARSADRDESVTALCQGPVVHWLESWRLRDLVATSEKFLALAQRARLTWYAAVNGSVVEENEITRDSDALGEWLDGMGVARFPLWVDSPGIGGGVVDTLRHRRTGVSEYWGWSPARDEKRFANRRAEVYWLLRSGLESGTAVLPRDEKLGHELLTIQWTLDAKGCILLEAKEDLRKRLGRSPDRADAVTIGYASQMGGLRGPEIRFTPMQISV